MELATAHRTTKPDSEKRDVVHFEVKKSAAPGDVEHERRLRLSDRDLQVLDLKAAGALSCLANTCTTFRARRPQWTPIPSWFVHSDKGARLRSGLLFRPALVVSIFGTIQQQWRAVMDGICTLEPQRIRLSSLGQSRELQLPRTTLSAPAALWALWSDASGQYR